MRDELAQLRLDGSRAIGEELAPALGLPGSLRGFCTLLSDTEVVHKVTRFNRDAKRGVRRNDDPSLALPWLVSETPIGREPELPFWADIPALYKSDRN